MAEREKPLPKPPTTPFGRKARAEEREETLMADRIAQAAAEGKVEEFLRREIPDSEHARALVSMMMGMTGMMPPGGGTFVPEKGEQAQGSGEEEPEKEASAPTEPPEDVRKAAETGDVKELMGLLEREHRKREPRTEGERPEDEGKGRSSEKPTIDREIIDQLLKIASENSLTLDWIMLRALKLYVREYQRTGRL